MAQPTQAECSTAPGCRAVPRPDGHLAIDQRLKGMASERFDYCLNTVVARCSLNSVASRSAVFVGTPLPAARNSIFLP